MRYLKKPGQRLDKLRTEIRPRKRGRVGRVVYLFLLAAFGFTLFDVLAGDLVYFQAKGLITQRATIVTPDYAGTVTALRAAVGDRVKAGQEVATVRSHQMLNDIAQLLAQALDLEARIGQLRIRRGNLSVLIPEARKQVKTSRAYGEDIEQLKKDGWATTRQNNAVMKEAYAALEKLKTLQSEVEIVDRELVALQATHDRLKLSLEKLDALYNQGSLTAIEEGVVGKILVEDGEGFSKGQRLIEIYTGPRYVLAYVSVGALYDIKTNDRVVVRYGFQTIEGRIDAPLPMAYELPREFQRAFQTVERRRLVRIAIDDEAPPLFTEVDVTWPFSVRVAFADAISFANENFASFAARLTGLVRSVPGTVAEIGEGGT